MTRKISFIARSPPTRKLEKPPCRFLKKDCTHPDTLFQCTDCLLASINEKLDSGGELQKKAVETWIDLMNFIVKEIKKDRRKKP